MRRAAVEVEEELEEGGGVNEGEARFEVGEEGGAQTRQSEGSDVGDGLGVLNGIRIHELVGGGEECDAGGSEKAVEDSVVLYIFVDGAELHFRGNTAPRCQIDCFVLGEQLPLFYQQVADPGLM